MFYLFGLSISFFLILLILLKRGKTGADYILLSWIIVIMLHLLLFYLQDTGVLYRYPHFLGVALPLPVLHGPFLYFYTIRTTRAKFLKGSIILACLGPSIIVAILAIPFYILPGADKIYVFENRGAGFEWFLVTQSLLIPCCGLFFSIISIREIRGYRKHLLDTVSNSDRKMLRWLEYMAIGLGIIWLATVFFDDPVIFAGVVLFVLLIGLFGINQTPVFYIQQTNNTRQSKNFVEDAPEIKDDAGNKYSKSGLSAQEATQLRDHLENFMRDTKPYRNPDLTLDALATALNIPSNQLSQVINSSERKTFYHYVNTHRIKEFLDIAARPESKKFTYLGLAYDCGFNSKTTFNKYFKILTGKTPSEYFGANAQLETS